MSLYNLSERRITNRLCEYWNSLRNNRNYPALQEINEEEINEIWPHCFIILLEDNENDSGPGFRYKMHYIGDEALESFGKLLKTSQDDEIIESVKAYLEEVYESNEPIIEESEHIDGYETIRFRQCFLPLSNDNSNINGILGAVRHRLVT